MPIYEFTCQGCATRFETLCRMGSNGEGLECPQCGGTQVRKVMSTFFSPSSSPSGPAGPSGGHSCSSCSSRNCATCH